MNLNDYLRSPNALTVAELRDRIGAKSDAQIRQWQHGYNGRRPDPEYCVAIEKATDGRVTRQDLYPKDWRGIWPELASQSATTDRRNVTRRVQADRRATKQVQGV